MKFNTEAPAGGVPNAQSIDPAAPAMAVPKPKQKSSSSSKKCCQCKVRLGLLNFECRCGKMFCSSHRYADEHNCSFDYRKLGQEEIQKNNPQVIGEKICKI